MAGKFARKLLFTTAGFIVVLMILAYVINERARTKLDNSVSALLNERVGVRHALVRRSVGSSYIDSSGEWWVELDDKGRSLLSSDSRLQRADDADREYFKAVLKQQGFSTDNLQGFDLFRAEMLLGPGTICEAFPCNVYVLRKTNDKNVYIGIYKN